MRTWFHAQLDQKIYDCIYFQGLGPSGVSLMNLVLRGEIEEAKQLIADGADVNQRTWFSENVIVIYSSL